MSKDMEKLFDYIKWFRDIDCGNCDDCALNKIKNELGISYCTMLSEVCQYLYDLEEIS